MSIKLERSTQFDLLDYPIKTTHPCTPPMYFTIRTTSLLRAVQLAAQRHHFHFESGSLRGWVSQKDVSVHPCVVPGERERLDERQGYVSLDMANKSATIITDSGDNSRVYSGVCRSTVVDALARDDWFLVSEGAWEVHSRPQSGANYCRYRIERGDA